MWESAGNLRVSGEIWPALENWKNRATGAFRQTKLESRPHGTYVALHLLNQR